MLKEKITKLILNLLVSKKSYFLFWNYVIFKNNWLSVGCEY